MLPLLAFQPGDTCINRVYTRVLHNFTVPSPSRRGLACPSRLYASVWFLQRERTFSPASLSRSPRLRSLFRTADSPRLSLRALLLRYPSLRRSFTLRPEKASFTGLNVGFYYSSTGSLITVRGQPGKINSTISDKDWERETNVQI